MTTNPGSDPAAVERLRFARNARRAADLAYQARVETALTRATRMLGRTGLVRSRRGAGLTEDRWVSLSRSAHHARSPYEFQAFARALHVSARWLAIGAGHHFDPPAGWATFGTNGYGLGVQLEFSAELGDDLMPLWERAVEGVVA